MDDQDQGDGGPPDLPHEGEGDAEPLEREEVSPEGIFVDQPEPVFSEEEDPESASPEHEPSPGSSRETPLLIDDDEHAEEAPSEEMEGSRPPEDEDGDDEGDFGQDDSLPEKPQDRDIRNGISACGQIHCQDQVDQYELRIQQRDVLIQTLMDIILKKNARLRSLKDTIKTLKDSNKTLKNTLLSRGRRIPEPLRSDSPESSIDSNSQGGINRWQRLLRDCIAGNQGYKLAWRSSQQNLNMSVDYKMCHPQVRFIERDPDEHGSSRQSSPSEVASVQQDEEIRAIVPLKLPDNIIFKILRELLTFEGLIHCFSRLDPFQAPSEFPSEYELRRSSTGLKGRFYISSEARSYLSLTHDTIDPQVLLAVLSVSRKFCWYGCHIFYGSNTFAFSSLGELDRFAGGINPARWSRLQHVELAWVGARCVRFNNDSKVRLNRRTAALAFFCESASLKTLCLHISESDKERRPYEPESQKIYMTGKTSGQPNKRMLRSMRSTLGIDYVYQLRGMHWIHVYDLSKEMVNPADRLGAQIRDRSFVLDLERVTTQEKVQARKVKSLLENLDLLFPLDDQRWSPGEEDFNMARRIFSEETGYDNLVNDLDHDADTSQGTISSDSEDGDSETDSEDSGSSTDPSPSPPGASSRHRSFTPAPRAAPDDDDEEHSDSGSDSDDDSFARRRRRRIAQYLRGDSAQSE